MLSLDIAQAYRQRLNSECRLRVNQRTGVVFIVCAARPVNCAFSSGQKVFKHRFQAKSCSTLRNGAVS